MNPRWLLGSALVAGCGRVGFDAALDASAPDDAGQDAAVEPRICARYPQALYCNDFEDGRGALGSDGTIVPTGGYGGSVGLKFTAGGGEMPGVTYGIAPVTQGMLWMAGRARIEPGGFVDEYLVLAQGTGVNFDKVSFDLIDLDQPQVVNSIDNGGGRRGAVGGVPRGTWFCFELAIDISATSAGGVTLRLDEQVVITDWQGVSTVPVGGYNRVELGAYAGNLNQSAITVTFDNWVVQTAPIGCP